jgi:hypothetical protein
VQFPNVEAAVHACIMLHNLDINGRLLQVTFVDPATIPDF